MARIASIAWHGCTLSKARLHGVNGWELGKSMVCDLSLKMLSGCDRTIFS